MLLPRRSRSDLTTLIYDAREHAIGLIRDEATAIGADDVVGIKTHIHEHGNLIEFMAIGTAVKKVANLTTLTPTSRRRRSSRTRTPGSAADHQTGPSMTALRRVHVNL